ncbi:MAG: hypothetical protein RBU29_10735, partial [bacterium]|nr:hypothetical protein [bacterium]
MNKLLYYLLFVVLSNTAVCADVVSFLEAKPVWPGVKDSATGRIESLAGEKNLFVGFRTVFEADAAQPVAVRLTASSLYRVFVNGEFAGHGPARGPHGYDRIDQWDISPLVKPGKNIVAIEVAGYNVNSFYLLDQPAYLCAEVLLDGRVLAATGNALAFEAFRLSERVQKVQRYSFQRPFSEAYHLNPTYDHWRFDVSAKREPMQLAEVGEKPWLPRRVPYPTFAKQPALRLVSTGTIQTGLQPAQVWKDRSLTQIGPQLGGYLESELETIPTLKLQTIANQTTVAVNQPYPWTEAIPLGRNSYAIVDLGTNLTGFLGATIRCVADTQLYITFDEILQNEDVNFKRLGCVNAIELNLKKGTTTFESFEPYTARYVKYTVLDGECEVWHPSLREYTNPDTQAAQFAASDQRLNRLFAAAKQTFAQNAVDVFMDCPSRERAGWLCDSYFTARVAFDLCRDLSVETNFFENYLLPTGFKHLPEGMLPMCYPSDHYDGVFIPNWSMFFVVQLEEYLQRSNDTVLVAALEPRVMKLLDYFRPFENSDGLLEKLESWVFVEWSEANRFVQDVNYPSNMLYAQTLSAAGRLYNKPELVAQAERLRETIRKQAFDGQFFLENALRKDGKLEVTQNHTEVCQYFAFYFGVATPEAYPELWAKLQKDFG